MHDYEDLRALFYTYITVEKDRDLIHRAYQYAAKKHAGQIRKSGEEYIHHPIEVAYICTQLQTSPTTIAAALLHDVVEDTDATIDEITELFGDEVSKIVEALTKIQRMKLSRMTAEDFEAEDHRKIFLGMAKDVRVIIVKLADRLHNLRTMDALSPERQIALSRETLDVFTPIAHRLGIYNVQSELEDLCLKYLEPKKYAEILDLVNQGFENRKRSLESLKKRIADILLEHKIKFRMESRVKSIYSIYRKMYQKGHSFSEIYDVLALRIITETNINCYEILGIIHSTYKPIPGRFKDYIAMPKPNMYQSLHTSVISGDGQVFEIQIRTEEMDSIAESGVAAHWKYKEGRHYNARDEQREIEEKLHWFRDFVSLSGNQDGTAAEFIANLTNDIFEANVYVFTPLGKVIDLPTGATTLDFAYKIHTKVGDSAVGAVVNGIGVPLNTVLKTGDVCEIRTSKSSAGPNDSWLEIARTASARGHIRRALQRRDAALVREEKIKAGKQFLADAFAKQDVPEEEWMKLIDSDNLRNEFHFSTLDDFFAMVGNKNPAASVVLDFLHIKKKPSSIDLSKVKKPVYDSSCPVEVAGGASNLAIGLAHCCTPIPGDAIVGYITKGKGITVHRANCPNIAATKRLIPVSWREDLGIASYPVDIEIYANDRVNLLAEILQKFGAKNIGVSDLKAHLIRETMNDIFSVSIAVPDAKVLSDLFGDLVGIKGVYSVKRVTH